MGGSPWLRTRLGVTLSNRVRASFYATIMSNGWMTNIQPGNASAPTEPVAALHSVEIRPESETGNYTGLVLLLSSEVALFPAAYVRCLEEVLDEIKCADYDTANDQQEQNCKAGYGEFELPIAILVRRR
jgi:hypothetical protein